MGVNIVTIAVEHLDSTAQIKFPMLNVADFVQEKDDTWTDSQLWRQYWTHEDDSEGNSFNVYIIPIDTIVPF